jgi:hypothetical protein
VRVVYVLVGDGPDGPGESLGERVWPEVQIWGLLSWGVE